MPMYYKHARSKIIYATDTIILIKVTPGRMFSKRAQVADLYSYVDLL